MTGSCGLISTGRFDRDRCLRSSPGMHFTSLQENLQLSVIVNITPVREVVA